MLACEFFVAGDPAPQPRARISAVRPGKGRVYTPRSAEGWRQRVSLAARAAWGRAPLEGALDVELEFVLERPPSHFTKRGALKASAPKYPTAKPDRDNLEKSTFDALNGVLWRDDAQVVSGPVSKRYVDEADREPGAHLKVRTLP